MRNFEVALIALVCIVPVLTSAKVTIWNPNTGSTLYHAEVVEIQWVCGDDDPICQTASLSFRLFKDGNSKLVAPITPISRGPTYLVWEIDPTLPQGDGFYLTAFNGDGALETECPKFSIKHSGIDIISPSVSTVWIPNSELHVRFTTSPLFSEKNQTLDVTLSDGHAFWLKLGQVSSADQVYKVPSDLLPWGPQPKFYNIQLFLSNQSLAKSNRFLLSSDPKLSCDDLSLAALYSAEAYYAVRQGDVFELCGDLWKSAFVYNVGDNAAFIVTSETSKTAVVAFRGTTQSLTDWMNTLSAVPVSCEGVLHSGCNGGFLHIGFGASFNVTRDAIRVVSYKLVQQGYRLILTGHSKGGAVAAIQALDLLQAFDSTITPSNLKLISFGQPRMGDTNFVHTLDAALPPSTCQSIRFVGQHKLCGKDPVTTLPPGQWSHGGKSILIPCSVGCIKRGTQGLALRCHFMYNYLDEIIEQNLGHEC